CSDASQLIALARSERMRDDCDRKIGNAERLALRTTQALEARRAYSQPDFAALRHFDTVVDTPRRARASVAGARDHRIALRDQIGHDRLRRRYRCTVLALLDDARDAVLLDQQSGEIVDQVMEVRLRVVDEADRLATQAVERPTRRLTLREARG